MELDKSAFDHAKALQTILEVAGLKEEDVNQHLKASKECLLKSSSAIAYITEVLDDCSIELEIRICGGERCAKCKFWHERKDIPGVGYCHKRPVECSEGGNGEAEYKETGRAYGCRFGEKKEPEPAITPEPIEDILARPRKDRHQFYSVFTPGAPYELDSVDDTEEKLLPCPFCGCKAEMASSLFGPFVRCTNMYCGAVQTPCDYEREAANNWNRRRA